MLTFKDLVFSDGMAECDFGNGRGVVVSEAREWPGFYEIAVVTVDGMGDVAKGLSPNDVSTKMVELQTAPMEFIPGHRYYISTVAEKLTKFARQSDTDPEPPCREGIKHASYAVDVVMTTPSNEGSWGWRPTARPHIAVYKGRQYLICRLAKDSGYHGKSEFHDPLTGKIYPKRQMEPWLPEKGAFGSYLTLPLATIKSADDITPEGNIFVDKPAAVTA